MRLDCLLNRLFRRRSKKTSKLRVTGLCKGNLPVTGEFYAQRASKAEYASISWRHHVWVRADTSYFVMMTRWSAWRTYIHLHSTLYRLKSTLMQYTYYFLLQWSLNSRTGDCHSADWDCHKNKHQDTCDQFTTISYAKYFEDAKLQSLKSSHHYNR